MSPTQKLLQRFLDRPNALTAANYRDSFEDYARYRKSTPEEAIDELIRVGYERANELVRRYLKNMVGTRNEDGELLSGRGFGPATVNLRLAVVRGVIKSARKAGLISWELDVRSVKHEDVKDNRGPSIDTAKKMIAKAKDLPPVQRERAVAIIRLFAEVGPRNKELVGLNVEDFDPDEPSIAIVGKGMTQKRVVKIGRSTADSISRWLAVRPDTDDGTPLFTNLIPGRYGRISKTAVFLLISGIGNPIANPTGNKASNRKGAKKRKIKRVSPHKMRHLAFTMGAEHAAKLGLPREALQKFTGHRDSRSVSRYIDAAEGAAQKLAEANAKALD